MSVTLHKLKDLKAITPETPFIKKVLPDGTACLIGFESAIYPNRDTSEFIVEIRMGLNDTIPHVHKRTLDYLIGVNPDGSYSVEPNLTHYITD